MWSTALHPHPWPALQWGAVLGASLGAAILDARSRRIPNVLTLPMLLAGLLVSTAAAGPTGLFESAATCVLLALPYVVLYAFAGGGAGDAKMMGAIGAWLGLRSGLVALVTVSIAALALGAIFAHRAGRGRETLLSVTGTAKAALFPLFGRGSLRDIRAALPPVEGAPQMPYGLAICAGVFLAAGVSLAWQP
jgi:prepilin peptidase CpaA